MSSALMLSLLACSLQSSVAAFFDGETTKPSLRRAREHVYQASDDRVNDVEVATVALSVTSRVRTVREYAPEMCNPLIGGQQYHAGVVCVQVRDNRLCVTYRTAGDWEMDAYHIWVGTSLSDMPATNKGNPKLGQFPYQGDGLVDSDRTELTVCTYPVDLGLPNNSVDLCEISSPVFVVAHADLEQEINNVTQTETGYGAGSDLNGSSWATYMNMSLCEAFDAPLLDEHLANLSSPSGTVTVRVTHQGGSSSEPYFKGTITYEGGGVDAGLDTYCVDTDSRIQPGLEYCALMLSSYNPNVTQLQYPLNNTDWNQVNYILNEYEIGDDLNSRTVLGGDIQRALWVLTTGVLEPPGAYSSGDSDNDTVEDILADAAANGTDFVPPCDGTVGVILYPVGRAGSPACSSVTFPPGPAIYQPLVAQALVVDFDSVCQCAVCSLEPPLAFDL